MREEDNAHIGPRGECICSGEEDKRRSAHEIGSLARVPDLRWSVLRFSEGVPGEKIFPINTARNGRMNAGKNRRMTNCGGNSSGTFAFSPRFQRIFESCRAISPLDSPLDSPLLQEFLPFLLFPAVLVKHSKLYSP